MKEEARRRIFMAALPSKKRKRQPLRTKREMRAQRLVAEEAESEEKWAGALQKGRSETLSAARIAGDNWVTEAEKASETTKGIPAKSRYPIDFVGAPRGIRTPDPLLRRPKIAFSTEFYILPISF